MNEDHNPDRFPRQPAKRKHADAWKPDLHPNSVATPKPGQQSDAQVEAEWAAFHRRKRGLDCVNDGGVEQE